LMSRFDPRIASSIFRKCLQTKLIQPLDGHQPITYIPCAKLCRWR